MANVQILRRDVGDLNKDIKRYEDRGWRVDGPPFILGDGAGHTNCQIMEKDSFKKRLAKRSR